MADQIPSAVRKIASIDVKARTAPAGGATGTKLAKSYGSTQGMKPAAFKAYKSIANQKVGGDPYSRAGREWLNEKPEPKVRTPKEKEDGDKKFMETAKRRFQQAADSESQVRKESLADLKFLSGEQWDDGIKRQRQMDGRPCLTINRLPQFVRQVTNEQRQNRPAIQVNPVGDNSDPDTAQILQGLIRHIEFDSAADAAYDTAFFGAAAYGYGYWRVTTEYSGPLSFEQDIKIKRIRNPFTVYFDPDAKEPDFSDAEWGFVIESMSKETYKGLYPKSKLASAAMDDWKSVGDNDSWVDLDTCRVAEYFWREKDTQTIVQLNDGSVVLKSLLPRHEDGDKKGEHKLPEGISVVNERDTDITTVKWVKMNGVEILEETEWAGRWIPIVKVVGDEFDIDGKIVLKGIVRDAKEPQQQFNYMKSAVTEAIALAPKAPYVGVEGQFEGHEGEWQTANTKSYAYLQYKDVVMGNHHAPPPQRNVVEPAIQAITLAMNEANDDLKAVTGIYDASLGAQGNETSGKAILARQQQAQGGNFHYIDNLTRAIRHCGRILLDLIPKVYDTQRVIRIIGDDGDQSTVTIGGQPQEPDPQLQQLEGEVQKIYDLSVGKYDVNISTGPSYQSRRQEAVSSILELVKADPTVLQVAGDLLVKNMDWPGAKEISDRLHKMLPPQLQQDDENPQQLPPAVQQHIAQTTQQVQQLTQALQQAQDDIKRGATIKKMETDSRERIAAGAQRIDELRINLDAAKIQATIVTAQAQLNKDIGEGEAQRLYDSLGNIMQQHHEAAMATMQHEQGMESAQQQAAIQSQQMDQQGQIQSDQMDQQNQAANDNKTGQ